MGTTVGYTGDAPSPCDLDGFVKVHEWLTDGVPVIRGTNYFASIGVLS